MDGTGNERDLGHVDTGRFGVHCPGVRRGMKVDLGRVCVRVAIEAPVDAVAIDVVERIHPEFAPLDIEPSALGVAQPIAEADLQFRGRDDVVVRRVVDERFEFEPQVTNPLERREIDRPELAGTVVAVHTASWWLASS